MSEQDARQRRLALKALAEAEKAGALLHARLEDVVPTAQHDGAEHHAGDLRESARLLTLVADAIGMVR